MADVDNKLEEPTVDNNAAPVVDGAGDKTEELSPPVAEMRAIVLSGFGGLKGVKIQKRPQPTPADGEVLVRIKESGLGFLDLMARQGAIDNLPKTPFILGFEGAGDVEAVGENVTTYQVGDKVAIITEHKAWAELVAVSTKYVYKLPIGMTYRDAVAVTLNYSLAHILLFEVAGLQPNKSIVVHSAGGGVGQAIVQLSQTVDNVTIYGIASQSKHEQLKDSGITHLINRTDYVQEIRKLSGDGVDMVFDSSYGDDCGKGLSLLKPLGRYILYGSSSFITGETKSLFSFAKSWWQVDKFSPIKLYDENRTISGFNLRHLLFSQSGHDQVRSAVEEVYKLWTQGKIKPIVDSAFALEDAADAMQKLHDRKNVGKVVLDLGLEPKPKPPAPEKNKKGEKIAASESKDKINGKSNSVESAEENGTAAVADAAETPQSTPAAEEVK